MQLLSVGDHALKHESVETITQILDNIDSVFNLLDEGGILEALQFRLDISKRYIFAPTLPQRLFGWVIVLNEHDL